MTRLADEGRLIPHEELRGGNKHNEQGGVKQGLPLIAIDLQLISRQGMARTYCMLVARQRVGKADCIDAFALHCLHRRTARASSTAFRAPLPVSLHSRVACTTSSIA
eukprot:365980-Chlamydomonas_euryale.AAC.10